MHYELCTVLADQDVFKEAFDIINTLGSGGEATVFLVECKKTFDRFALVLDRELKQLMKPKHEMPVIKAMMDNQKINPHQAHIFDYFWIQSKNLGRSKQTGVVSCSVSPVRSREEGDILTRVFDADNTAETFRHRAYLLEVGVCDLDSKKYRELLESENCSKEINIVLREIGTLSLQLAGIVSDDDKLRNHIIVKADTCHYKGKKFIDYDYWAYHLEEDTVLYIPKQEYLVKRIDFMNWGYKPHRVHDSTDYLKKIRDILIANDLIENNLESLLIKPEIASDKILDVYPLKSFQPQLNKDKHAEADATPLAGDEEKCLSETAEKSEQLLQACSLSL